MPEVQVKHTVGVADMKVSNRLEDVLITYALGSCLGITLFDPVARVGGLLHVMLPSAGMHREKARQNPYMFVDTGVPRLFQEAYRLGARKERIVVKVAGGAAAHDDENDSFQIGRNNFLMLRKLFWKNRVPISAHDVGGRDSRTVWIEVATGEVVLKTNGVESTL
jgi:chemotaxis protein CheD